MVSHLMLSNVTDEREPSTLSKRVVTDILRNELEFDGVVMTDAMNMKAITNDYSAGEAAVKALQAGVDVILMPDDLAEAYKAVKKRWITERSKSPESMNPLSGLFILS